jgi:hypothetical protein
MSKVIKKQVQKYDHGTCDKMLLENGDNTEYRIKPKWEKRQEVPLFYERYDCYIPQKIHDFDTIHQFVTEFETDWDNQTCEVFKDFNKNYKVILCDTYPSLGVVRMSKVCAQKLCDMLNSGEIELCKI